MAVSVILSSVLISIWNLISIFFNFHISIGSLAFRTLPYKFHLYRSKISIAWFYKLFQIPPTKQFWKHRKYVVK
jgi:hypothetical protein